MRKQIADTNTPEWAFGLPEDVVSVVRQEAIRRGIPSIEVVKEWTLEAARKLRDGHAKVIQQEEATA